MPFCSNCGQQINDGAKFCPSCGTAVSNEKTNNQRKTVFEGEIHKCPNCGEVLDSFEVNCPTCGHEFRGAKNSLSVREFAAKLEEIERTRPTKGFGLKKMLANQLANQKEVSETDLKKISLIRSYVIPNTKEDMLEFLILASSNINLQRYNDFDSISESEKAVSDAWEAKFEQAYEKAKLSFGDTPEFKKIKAIYDKKTGEVEKSKKKRTYFWIGFAGFFVILIVVMFGIIFGIIGSESKAIAAENERLKAIVEQVYDALEADNFVLARARAASLVFSGPDNDEAEIAAAKWDTTRKEVLDIIDKAEYGTDYVPTNREIRLGLTKDDFKDENYQDVKKQLQNRGFTNIKTEPIYDLTTGWWTSEGSVERVTFNGDTVYTEDTVYSSNIEVMIYYHALKSDAPEQTDKTDTDESKDSSTTQSSNTKPTSDSNLNVSIEKGPIYTYGHDEWDLYVVTAISDSTIKIEKWGKTLSSQKSFSHDYDVGAFKITDAENGFSWLDDEHNAFKFVLKDKSNGDFKKSKEIVFTISGTDGDTNKGANYSKNKTSYKYQNDDWHLYRAIPLSDNLIKIECWYRSMAIGSFYYGYDVVVVDLGSSNSDLEWSDDSKTSFTISLKDTTNSDLKKEKFVVFEKE